MTTSSGGSDEDRPAASDTPNSLAASDQSSTRSEEDRIEALVAKGLGERALLVRARRRAVQPGWQLEKVSICTKFWALVKRRACDLGILLMDGFILFTDMTSGMCFGSRSRES